MSDLSPISDYLVISRGQWDVDAPKEDIQAAIDEFYQWLQQCIDEGTMRMGSRLATGGATVTKTGIVTDGPFGEAKEVIGGYWIIVATSLEEAAALAAKNPCLKYGIFYEIRLMDPNCASAFSVSVETPNPSSEPS